MNEAKLIAKPLYRRCDSLGICPKPDAECRERCLTSNQDEEMSGTETVVIWAVITLIIGLLLMVLGGMTGYLWQVMA
jgi:hypothetical protein